MVVLSSRNIYLIEVPELFTATVIPITAAAESSSLETHLSSGTVCRYSCFLLLSPFMCLYTHIFKSYYFNEKKSIGHQRKCTCGSKKHFAAILICSSADGEPTIILASLRFPVIKTFCLCIYQTTPSDMWCEMWACHILGQEFNLTILVSPFQLKRFYDSIYSFTVAWLLGSLCPKLLAQPCLASLACMFWCICINC